MISVAVTGKNSQLARCIKDEEKNYPNISITYFNSKSLDITDIKTIEEKFNENNFDYCINCAAYTNVEKAEIEPEKAKSVNTKGALNIAKVCKKHKTVLIHISTDFVFDGKKRKPYTEEDKTNPLNVYGKTKRDGELEIIKTIHTHFIIRTSWLYSEYGKNFVKTILKLSKEKEKIDVVNDQIGSPTYAGDLASSILRIISSEINKYGIYHFSNKGKISWYEFACKIIEILSLNVKIKPISNKKYQTKTIRPKYSVLAKTKINREYDLIIPDWELSLVYAIRKYKYSKSLKSD